MGLLLRSGDDRLAVCRLSAGATVPDWVDGRVISVTRTPSELSIVCAEASVPDEIRSERGWRYLEVSGPLDFSLTGVVSTLTVPLADAGIPVFVLSTFDTDYVLVKDSHLARAVSALVAAGHAVEDATGRPGAQAVPADR